MTRIAGTPDRSEIILDPVEAWRRGRMLDRMLAQAAAPHPGVYFAAPTPSSTGSTPSAGSRKRGY